MIVIDYSHTMNRMLHVAILEAKPRKVDGKLVTADFISFYAHLLLSNLKYVVKYHSADYGEVVIAQDARNYWRKEIYPDYKGQRKAGRDESEIDFGEFFEEAEKITARIKENFPYKFVKVDRAEADDIMYFLAKESTEKSLIVTSDKDLKQTLIYDHVDMFDPIKKEFISMDQSQITTWMQEHILLGDAGDNIMNIKDKTIFSDKFKDYLKSKDIYTEDVKEFNALSISEKLYDEYDVFKKITAGKKKGQFSDVKDIFKKVPFGQKGVEKFMLDLKTNLASHPMYQEKYDLNKELVIIENAPKDIQDAIFREYANAEVTFNSKGIMDFLMEYNLKKLATEASDFYTVGKTAVKNTSCIDDWL